MERFDDLLAIELTEIVGGNRAGSAVVSAAGCATAGIKIGKYFGPWGAVIGGVGGAAVCAYLTYTAN